MKSPSPYTLAPLTLAQSSDAVELDRLCLGGLWNIEGYQREVHSPNSDLLALWRQDPDLLNAQTHPTAPPLLVGIGCLWAILDEAHITLLFIHPQYRRQGLARALLGKLLRLAQARGLEWATLEVGVGNTAALSLYDQFGFEAIGTRKGYYQKTGEDARILWCKDLQNRTFPDSESFHSQFQDCAVD